MFAHSYSSVSKFETCPRQFEYRYILGHREPQTEATMWGTRVHEALEAKAKGADGPLPEGMEKMEWAVAPVLKAKETGMLVLTEHKIAVDRYMKPVTFDSKQAWLRAILDVAILHGGYAMLNDYKTGKRRPTWQLQLGALLTFYTYPAIQQIETRYLYLKETAPAARTDKSAYVRATTPTMAGEIFPRVIRVEKALESGKFDPKPSGLCRGWCPCTTCEFWSPKK